MEFILNNSPEASMLEITKKLFNKKFLSNIEFNIEDQVIYAHSHELMKRSVVFQKQLELFFNKPQKIPIENFSYTSFYEFIRFIYTEECDVNIENSIELFKLAIHYKVVKLENQVLDYLLQRGVPLRIRLSLYELCVKENYELPYNVIKNDISRNLNAVMDLNVFTQIEQSVMEDILKLDCIDENIKEVQLFNGLIRWMNKFCDVNEIDLKQRRQKFESLLQLIRFPQMTMEEFRESVVSNCDLFADSDLCAMFKVPTPPPKPRKACEKKYDRRNIMNNTKSETKFTVSTEVLFTGFRYGAGGNHEIKITGRDLVTNNIDVIKLNKKFKDDSIYKTISLGESLILKPNIEYIIQILYDNGGYTCWCATYRMSNIIIHDPLDAVQITQPGITLFEIFFKSPNDELFSEPTMDDTSSELPATTTPTATSELPQTDSQTAGTPFELPKTEILSETKESKLLSSTETPNAETVPEPSQIDKPIPIGSAHSIVCSERSTKEGNCEPSPEKTADGSDPSQFENPNKEKSHEPQADTLSERSSGNTLQSGPPPKLANAVESSRSNSSMKHPPNLISPEPSQAPESPHIQPNH